MAPLLLCQRFRGTMDDWDPELIFRLVGARRVIRFDSIGIGESEGETPSTVSGMAEIVPALLDALKIDKVDLLGWSLGGYVAQTVTLNWPERVRRLVIAGSGPGGPDGPPPHPRVAEITAKTAIPREDARFLLFTESQAGLSAAERHFSRIRFGEREMVTNEAARRQREATVAWWSGDGASRARLAELSLPVLVANGISDVMIPAEHSFAIVQVARDAKLILYPDAGHAFLFQYACDFAAEVLKFLCS
ncbi:alpha/beta fold hydrolase [Dyella psychrodurans]|uniref:alpha/beta fold hydrolase n=1 Tax=Dyella psychrodurans TaxID=1927960 RepID=UPI0018F49A11|nr:alpha/beta hydrolase [Dyella psychrodurans]